MRIYREDLLSESTQRALTLCSHYKDSVPFPKDEKRGILKVHVKGRALTLVSAVQIVECAGLNFDSSPAEAQFPS